MRDYNIQSEGSSALPITGGTDTFLISGMKRDYEHCYVQVSFYSDASLQTRVTPSTGTVAIRGSMTGERIWRTIADGDYNAVDSYSETRAIPSASGTMTDGQVVFTGVDAAYAKVLFMRY